MSNRKEEDSDDPFREHRISYTLEKDFDNLMKSQEIADFQQGLSYKSPKTAQKDLAAFDLLVNRLKAYKKGWIQANTMQTVKLAQAHDYLQWEAEQIRKSSELLNDLMNGMIRMIKDKIPPEKLQELREMEIELRKIKANGK